MYVKDEILYASHAPGGPASVFYGFQVLCLQAFMKVVPMGRGECAPFCVVPEGECLHFSIRTRQFCRS